MRLYKYGLGWDVCSRELAEDLPFEKRRCDATLPFEVKSYRVVAIRLDGDTSDVRASYKIVDAATFKSRWVKESLLTTWQDVHRAAVKEEDEDTNHSARVSRIA